MHTFCGDRKWTQAGLHGLLGGFRFLQGATEMRDRVVSILMTGTKFHYRSARLHGFRLEMKLTEDDMPTPDDAG